MISNTRSNTGVSSGRCRRCREEVPRGRSYCSAECLRRVMQHRARAAEVLAVGPVTAEAAASKHAHRLLRLATVALAVGTPCVLCGEVMVDPARMDLDHTVDRTGYRGYAHADCNRRDGGRRGAAAMRAKYARRRLAVPRG